MKIFDDWESDILSFLSNLDNDICENEAFVLYYKSKGVEPDIDIKEWLSGLIAHKYPPFDTASFIMKKYFKEKKE